MRVESPSRIMGVCCCTTCHDGPIPQRPRQVRAGLCADCIEEFFTPWDKVLDELEEIDGTQ